MKRKNLFEMLRKEWVPRDQSKNPKAEWGTGRGCPQRMIHTEAERWWHPREGIWETLVYPQLLNAIEILWTEQ